MIGIADRRVSKDDLAKLLRRLAAAYVED